MKFELRAGWIPWNARFEGSVPFLYADVKNLVTIAVGNLVDPVDTALGLPLMRPDGTRASRQEIADEWHLVKSRQDLIQRGGMAYGAITRLRLTPAGIASVVLAKLAGMEAHLAARFSEWATWPWQAQQAVLSMSWAMGPSFVYPHFEAAARKHDWATCAAECWIGPKIPDPKHTRKFLPDPRNPGVHPRNLANVALLEEAARLERPQEV